jgi:hypothetical protein
LHSINIRQELPFLFLKAMQSEIEQDHGIRQSKNIDNEENYDEHMPPHYPSKRKQESEQHFQRMEVIANSGKLDFCYRLSSVSSPHRA